MFYDDNNSCFCGSYQCQWLYTIYCNIFIIALVYILLSQKLLSNRSDLKSKRPFSRLAAIFYQLIYMVKECKPKKKQRYPFLLPQHTTRLAVLWVGVWLIFSWVEKFSSLTLTISIVIAASTHTYSIRNSAGCNKFMPVLWGLSRGILWNKGDNYLK